MLNPESDRNGKVLILGTGRGASQIISRIHDQYIPCVHTMYVGTDSRAVNFTKANVKFLIGRRLCGGNGAMGFSDLGEKAAEEARRDLEPYLKGYGLIMQVSTLGKGTGSGTSHVLASLAEAQGAFVINFLILPSSNVEMLPRTVANHSRNSMVKRGFNVITIDQDRFHEMNGNQPISVSMASLDALISCIVTSIASLVYGNANRNVSISDLRAIFREGNEGSIFIGGGNVGDPTDTAREFLSNGLITRDPKTGKGFLFNFITPEGFKEAGAVPFMDEILSQVEGNKTVFFGNLEDPSKRDALDLIGIVTGMEDGRVKLPASVTKHMFDKSLTARDDKWDIPMVR